ncbi:MAG: RimK family protein [Candidatus Gastranaerophilales bacterium]|nr:RimK family protein [Candidatus Gastranaerophilales bacterium]
MKYIVITDHKPELIPKKSNIEVVSSQQYIENNYNIRKKQHSNLLQIINLTNDYDYLKKGYYCSLLGNARGENVIPSADIIIDLNWKALYKYTIRNLNKIIDKLYKAPPDEENKIHYIYFGKSKNKLFKKMSKLIFERFKCPILKVELAFGEIWKVKEIETLTIKEIPQEDMPFFIESLDKYTKGLYKDTKKIAIKYRMAILQDPADPTPASSLKTINKITTIGASMGIDIDVLSRKDLSKLSEYDALFIRETTYINHHTYKFAQKARELNIPVIDDPESIIKCTNKVYLGDLFKSNNIPTPKTINLCKKTGLRSLKNQLGFPLVLKTPDGSFGRGVFKIKDSNELKTITNKLFNDSEIIIAQEFVKTDFDWRIGILNNMPIYACKYYMASKHWQIIKTCAKKSVCGKSEGVKIKDIPQEVLEVAIQTSRLIGDGLYGVDIKQTENEVLVIEINDNPSIDNGVEDIILKDDLYRIILGEFLRRIEE